MKKLLVCIVFIGCLLSFIPNSACGQTTSSSTAITAVSDTTDDETTSATLQGAATDSIAEDSNVQTPFNNIIDDAFNSHWKWLENFTNIFNLTGGSFLLFFVILFFLIIISPIILIVLLIVLLVKALRRRNNAQYVTPTPSQTHPVVQNVPITSEEQKDKAILLMALGAGFSLLCLVVGSNTGIGVGLLIVCLGIGKWVIANRQSKRNNNENQDK